MTRPPSTHAPYAIRLREHQAWFDRDPVAAVRAAMRYREPARELCAVECGARCCRGGLLVVTAAERDRLAALPGGEALMWKAVAGTPPLFEASLAPACPFLTWESLCGIYASRPRACREFPSRPADVCVAWPATPRKRERR